MTVALFPATFDPVTYGHIDIAARAAAIFEGLVVGVYAHPRKGLLFPVEKRLEMVEQALSHLPNASVESYDGLTVEFAREKGARVLVRGLRVMGDFELEFQMATMNRKLAPEIETVSLMTSQEYYFLSSSIVRELAKLGGDISDLVPPHVEKALHEVLEELGPRGEERIEIISIRE